jgi:hypothetical protein
MTGDKRAPEGTTKYDPQTIKICFGSVVAEPEEEV